MKSFLTLILFVAGCAAFAQPANEIKLTQTLKEFHKALVEKNTVSINQQTDKALSYGHSNGMVETKAELIKNLETGLISYQSFKEDSVTVAINGTMANVRFVADIIATTKEATITNHLKVLEVWVKKGNRWVLFARQGVKIN